MTVWRPKQYVCVQAIGLPFRGNSLLAAEVLDYAGEIKGVRPLGGHVDFGENWHQTIVREFHEELNVTVSVESNPVVLENIYQHEGEIGHEVIFVAKVSLPDDELTNASFVFQEDEGTECTARWFDIEKLDSPEGPVLFPEGLRDKLEELQL